MADHLCPVWVGHLLACPARKLLQNPRKILGPYVEEGMTVLDVGCAMGFFSLPAAELVGAEGKVVCVDLQEKMLRSLGRRARKAGLAERIEARLCRRDSLDLGDLAQTIDLGLLFAVVHEVPEPARLFSQIHEALKPTGKVLVAEPTGHVRRRDFEASVSMAEQSGFALLESLRVAQSHAVLLAKKR